ncbi:MAG TPA: hypothetical protein VK118_01995 [Tetragenococcus sp.]|nr:hypothetical protein [Tetragenococcus sp.]
MSFLSLLELKVKGRKLKAKYKVDVLSATFQRVRLHSEDWENQAELLADLKEILLSIPEIKGVRITPMIGTITMEFCIPNGFSKEIIQSLEDKIDRVYRKRGVWR